MIRFPHRFHASNTPEPIGLRGEPMLVLDEQVAEARARAELEKPATPEEATS